MKTIKLEYDDNGLDIIKKLNDALKEHKLEFRDDGQEHDGFVLLTLERLE
jgi:hypothetical protein